MAGSAAAPSVPGSGPAGRAAVRGAVVESAGAVVWRLRKDRLQVRLVHRPRYRDWSWPKGKVDPGESLPAAAVREVAEETGRAVVLGIPLPTLEYPTPEGRLKRVHYWAARRAADGDRPSIDARPPASPVDATEIDDAAWLDAEAARERLTRPADREPLDALVRAWRHDRLDTRAVVVSRHARARKRAQWAGGEADRPLTPLGAAQAVGLVQVLAAFGVVHVATSEWLRCTQTVQPYADATGRSFVEDPRLTEAAHTAAPGAVAAAVRDVLEAGPAAVLCTHRPVLPTVLDVLSQHARRRVADALPREDPFLRPAQSLVCHVARTPKGPRVMAVELAETRI